MRAAPAALSDSCRRLTATSEAALVVKTAKRLGCMSYGSPGQGNHAWSLGEDESRPFIRRALQGGINYFDTANRYSLGTSEGDSGTQPEGFRAP